MVSFDVMKQLSILAFRALVLLIITSSAISVSAQGQSEIKFVPEDGETYDGFGGALFINDHWAFVGSSRHEVGEGSGAVYVYALQGTNWVLFDKLTPTNDTPIDRFGSAVALSGNTLLIGASGNFENNAAAFIFEYIGGVWTQTAKLVSEDEPGFGDFGDKVALFGDVAVIGARTQDYDDGPGAAYVFEKQGAAWTQTAKLVSDDGERFDSFGSAVAVYKHRIAVGAYRADGNASLSGVVYIFERRQGGWVQTAKLQASDGGGIELFGVSLSMFRNRLVIGNSQSSTNGNDDGSAYIFEYHKGQWVEVAKLVSSDGTNKDSFGHSVSMSGNKILVGAPGDGDKRDVGPDAGAAYLFEYRRGSWEEVRKIVPSDAFSFDLFGNAVALHGETALIGAPINVLSSFLTDNPGAAYIIDTGAMQSPGAVAAQGGRDMELKSAPEQAHSFALHSNYPNPFNPTNGHQLLIARNVPRTPDGLRHAGA